MRMAPFDPFIFERIHNIHCYSKGEVESSGKLPRLWEEDDSRNKFTVTDGLLSLNNLQNLDSLFLDTAPPFQPYEHQMQDLAKIESQYSELIEPKHDSVRYEVSGRKLSTDEIIRFGGERFIQSSSSSHPYGNSFSGLSDHEAKDVELVENLLLSAEKVDQQQFDRASKLLDWCDMLSSSSGNPIQRIVHYFSKALRDKIASETGGISSVVSGKKRVYDIERKFTKPNLTVLSMYQKLPFYQAAQFAGVQALVDGVTGSTKVHIIDLSIKNGIQCTILMQALASQQNCPIVHLKITAIGTDFKQKIELTGDRLKSFAESINLSFSFDVIIVKDMLDFKEDLLDLDPEEALGVYSSYGLWSMIAHQDRLESLMKVIKNINPRVMVVSEAAANLNSPNFVNRFIEALFFYGALFDSLEDCMDGEDETRTVVESMYMEYGIWSIVAAEGPERAIRHVTIDVWRKFFARFGMKEIELSMSALYQANLIAEKISSGNSCTFDMDDNCLVIGWKGTPIHCLSAWEFSQE